MRVGKRSIKFESKINVISSFSIVAKKERDGNFGLSFDRCLSNDLWGEKSYEKAECKIMRETIMGAIKKAKILKEDIDYLLAGDLLNEITASSLAARCFPCGFLGLYNACSTFGEAVILGSLLLESKNASTIAACTSSHFSSAERQYRFPLELGNQRTPTSQWTVTGSGCVLLSCLDSKIIIPNPSMQKSYGVKVTEATIGRVVDMGVVDASNMGAAMAPAAADTLITHFQDMETKPTDYDLVLTGDLGKHGKKLLEILMKDEGYQLPEDTYNDCGAMYYKEKQHTIQGGSGAGCSSSAFCGYFLKKMFRGEINKILLVPTGALLSKDTPLQKESIPSIAHAVCFETFEMQ